MVLVIDNYDSFTFNLVQLISKFTKNIEVRRNDKISLKEIKNKNYSHIIISPGPKYPKDAGITMEVIKNMSGKIPILGVCLGHQAIVEVFGGNIMRLIEPFHGKTSEIKYKKIGIFKNVNGILIGARYHSLVADMKSIPNCLEVIGKSEDNLVMAISHKSFNTIGLQFHPESFLSNNAENIIGTFLNIKGGLK
ncbi:anthranilate synthase component II [Helicovermis profundi]|uniref:Glutamine amidotransferase domain-containing protein n=1 Tax=Helicovermis profundi TaxID=3065157 RepID=A0AAU9E4F1_9FIRM|nr:hypothetical protein HLPR_11910 [Clostridia bacterium S502]